MSARDAPSNPFSRKRAISRPSMSSLLINAAGIGSRPRRRIERRGLEQIPAQAPSQIELRPFSHRQLPVAAGAPGRVRRILGIEAQTRLAREGHHLAAVEIE